ncbi:MAG: homoserine O-acetyltransferase [Desulfurivibrio sp.]|nr:homoserine O-acetyltransferase [Desulfurivibrio sp.]
MSEYVSRDVDDVSIGIVEKKFYTFAEAPAAPLVLESGAELGPVTVAYETYGQLSPRRDNAVLVLHALTGDCHAAGYYSKADPKPGWWENMVGPGKGIDTDRYFVICSSILGSCGGTTGPGSTSPVTGKPYALDFPVVTVGDMVEVQHRLLKHLGIDRLLAVVGGSLGGMQALEWSLRYPAQVDGVIALATTMRHSALAIAFNEVSRQAIMADPNWKHGNYYGGPKPATGLAVARMIGHVTYLSDEALRRKFGRRLQGKEDFSFEFDIDFQVESYLRHQGSKFVERFDANSFLYVTKASDYFDLGRRDDATSAVEAFAPARSRFLVVSFTSDWLYPTYQSRELVRALKKNRADVSFCEIKADSGHDAFLITNRRLSALVGNFLASTRDGTRLPAAPPEEEEDEVDS